MTGMPDPDFNSIDEFDKFLVESDDPLGTTEPAENTMDMDVAFGQEPIPYVDQGDPRRRGVPSPIATAVRAGTSAFDLASQFSIEDLTNYRDQNGNDANDPRVMDRYTRADTAVMIATRLATRAIAPTPDEVLMNQSPTSEAISNLSDAQFNELVADAVSGGRGYGLSREVREVRKSINNLPVED